MAISSLSFEHRGPDLAVSDPPLEHIAGWTVRPRPMTRLVVRILDVTIAFVALALLAPLMAVIAGLVRLTSRGPILYRSPRIAHDRPVMMIWKFRTMFVDADDRLDDLLATDRAAQAEYDQYFKLKEDPRVTALGRLLRQSSLDELPQLVNVLNGEMSIVGPRPKLLREQERYGDALAVVLRVKPGLTGLWQVSGRNRLTLEERISLDLKYACSRTLLGDLYICMLTLVQFWHPSRHGAC